MKRFLVCLLALSLSGVISASAADKVVRAVQKRLKHERFYFGKVDGVYNSETAVAISRYQIRSGLEINGRIDPETANALGVKLRAQPLPAPPAAAETWRQLRKSDPRFLAGERRKKKPPTANPLVVDPTTRTLVLSRERLRDYVAGFILAGLDPQVGAEMEFFGDQVDYFDDGMIGREKIRRDLERYDRRWPERRFWLAGEVNVEPRPDSLLRVTFPLRFELRNGSKHVSGKVMKTLLVEVMGEDLNIVGVSEKRINETEH